MKPAAGLDIWMINHFTFIGEYLSLKKKSDLIKGDTCPFLKFLLYLQDAGIFFNIAWLLLAAHISNINLHLFLIINIIYSYNIFK